MHIAAALFFVVVLVPDVALACMNTITRHFTTFPLDFAHLGIVLAALVLLRWPRNVENEGEPAEPSMTRQFAILAAFTTAGIGYGFFDAKIVGFELTSLTVFAIANVVIIALAIGLSAFDGSPSVRGAVRRGILVVAALASMVGSVRAIDGHVDEWNPAAAFQPADPAVTEQVTF